MENKDKNSDIAAFLPFLKTRNAVKELEKLLLCQICMKPPNIPIAMSCEHSFCRNCIASLADSNCPICNIPTLPCDRKPDSIISCLTESCKDFTNIFNGGKLQIKPQGLEAPESNSQFPYTNTSFNNSSQQKNVKNTIPQSKLSPSSVSKVDFEDCSNNNNNNTKLFKLSRLSKKSSKKSLCTVELESSMSITGNLNEISKAKAVSLVKDDVTITGKQKQPSQLKCPTTPTTFTNSKVQELKTPCTPAINKRNSKGETLLHTHCLKGHFDRVKLLLEDGANPNTKDNAGWTPLHEACNHGFNDIVSTLLNHGALVNVPGPSNETPLHEAVNIGCIPTIRLLKQWGANDEIRDLLGKTPRSLGSLCKSPLEIIEALDECVDDSLDSNVSTEPLSNKIVLMESRLTPQYRKTFDKVVKLLKAKTVTEFSHEVTHIVVGCEEDSTNCHRTVKYMMGIVSGAWIVSHKWLDACLTLGGPSNPNEFEVLGSKNLPYSYAQRKGRLNALKMNPGLFSGCHFYLTGAFNEINSPSKKEIESLIKAGNGINLQREPNPENLDQNEQTVPFHCTSSKDPLWQCSHFIIYQDGVNEPKLKYDMSHIKSLPLSWLLDSADNFSLNPPYI